MKETFLQILKQNQDLMKVLDYLEELQIPNYCICSGVINQTIWNYLDHHPLNQHIHDIDILYEDPECFFPEQETQFKEKLTKHFQYNYKFDLHNICIMHLWKAKKLNQEIQPFLNMEDAVKRVTATVQAVGITKKEGKLFLYAPYGVDDIFHKIIRPIKDEENTKKQYDKKVKSWQKRFSNLQIIEW